MKICDALKKEESCKAADDRVNDVYVGNSVLEKMNNEDEDEDASSNSDDKEDNLCLNDDINIT